MVSRSGADHRLADVGPAAGRDRRLSARLSDAGTRRRMGTPDRRAPALQRRLPLSWEDIRATALGVSDVHAAFDGHAAGFERGRRIRSPVLRRAGLRFYG